LVFVDTFSVDKNGGGGSGGSGSDGNTMSMFYGHTERNGKYRWPKQSIHYTPTARH
jgi:hypothetical protein